MVKVFPFVANAAEIRLKVKPVVLAREHDAVNGDLRRCHKHDDHGEGKKRQCGIDATEQKGDPIYIK